MYLIYAVAKYERNRRIVDDLELPSIGLMVAVMVAPPSGSEPSLLGPAASL
jgi:hypothetical protein